jgi:hypothetical protein
VNDFDDACELPFTSDLVRLATSAMLAASDARVNVSAREVCALLIEGYRSSLKLEGQPILVASGQNRALVALTKDTQEDPQTFWKKKLDPETNPPIDGRDLPKGLEHMLGASFQPGARPTFREQKSPGGWAASAAGATPPSPSRAKASATDAKQRRSCHLRSIG